MTLPTASHIQELTDCPGWMVIDHPRRRRRRDGRGQRAGRDRLDLRDMEGGVDATECGGEVQANRRRVDHLGDGVGADEAWGEFGRNPLQGKVLSPQPNPLSGGVLRERVEAWSRAVRVRFQMCRHLGRWVWTEGMAISSSRSWNRGGW